MKTAWSTCKNPMTNQQPALIIMAAGIGSRYGGLKQVDPIGPNGEIIIDYSVYDALRAGFGKVIFLIRKEIEDIFREKIGRTVEQSVDTAYVFQEVSNLPPGFIVPAERVKPWGTGHAVLSCKHVVDRPFAVINADDFYGPQRFSPWPPICDRQATRLPGLTTTAWSAMCCATPFPNTAAWRAASAR